MWPTWNWGKGVKNTALVFANSLCPHFSLLCLSSTRLLYFCCSSSLVFPPQLTRSLGCWQETGERDKTRLYPSRRNGGVGLGEVSEFCSADWRPQTEQTRESVAAWRAFCEPSVKALQWLTGSALLFFVSFFGRGCIFLVSHAAKSAYFLLSTEHICFNFRSLTLMLWLLMRWSKSGGPKKCGKPDKTYHPSLTIELIRSGKPAHLCPGQILILFFFFFFKCPSCLIQTHQVRLSVGQCTKPLISHPHLVSLSCLLTRSLLIESIWPSGQQHSSLTSRLPPPSFVIPMVTPCCSVDESAVATEFGERENELLKVDTEFLFFFLSFLQWVQKSWTETSFLTVAH